MNGQVGWISGSTGSRLDRQLTDSSANEILVINLLNYACLSRAAIFAFSSLLRPLLRLYIVDIRVVVLVTIGVNFVILAQEGALVECILARKVAGLRDLVLGRVENVG